MSISISISTPAASLEEQIEAGQAALGVTDRHLCDALGWERGIVLTMIKAGTMRLPLNKVPALAAVLSLDASELLRSAMLESTPELLAVIEDVFNPLGLTTSEHHLIRHLRELAGDRRTAPIVFDGQGVVALITV